jgi:ATP-binding cassette subfamily B protein
MILHKKTYKTYDTILLAFKLSPVWIALHMLLTLAQAIIPTAGMAIATANFVDTAMAILNGERLYGDIYLPLIVLLLVLGLVSTIGSVSRLISVRIHLNLRLKLTPAVVEAHALLNFKHIENANSWELVNRVSGDPVGSVMNGFGSFMSLIHILVSVASVLILIVSQVWWAAIVIIIFSVPMFWFSYRAGKKNYQAGRDAEKFNRRTGYLEGVLTGRDNVDERTLFGYGGELNERWQKQYEAGRILRLKVLVKNFTISRGSFLLMYLVGLLVTLTLVSPVTTGELSAGMFMGIMNAVFSMVVHLGLGLSGSLEGIARAAESMKDLTAFLKLDEAENALCEPDAEPPAFQSLEFRNVRFKYPSGEAIILDGFSFKLEAGLHYAFVGRNGAGKTTITKLLTGLYSEYDGEILINGKELRTYPAGTVKAMFSVVYQDFAKYYISIKDNIRVGDIAGKDLDNRILEMVLPAHLSELVEELKEGLDTYLGKIKENGQDISGGQWQRIAIARSLLSRAPVKILDEPTAALDPVSESRIYEEFEQLMHGKTTIFISHRLGSTKLADEILVIDDGKIIERGSHDELMTKAGQYAAMFEAQRSWYQ